VCAYPEPIIDFSENNERYFVSPLPRNQEKAFAIVKDTTYKIFSAAVKDATATSEERNESVCRWPRREE
jgi:hypothetical protein